MFSYNEHDWRGMSQKKRDKIIEANKKFGRRVSKLQNLGYTIYRIWKLPEDENWGYKNTKTMKEGSGFDSQIEVVSHLEKKHGIN